MSTIKDYKKKIKTNYIKYKQFPLIFMVLLVLLIIVVFSF